jgi:hypothetical protein
MFAIVFQKIVCHSKNAIWGFFKWLEQLALTRDRSISAPTFHRQTIPKGEKVRTSCTSLLVFKFVVITVKLIVVFILLLVLVLFFLIIIVLKIVVVFG